MYDYLNNKLLFSFSRYCTGAYSLWGGTVNDIFTVVPDKESSYHSTSFYAMSITGPSVQSWSIVLKNNLHDSEIEKRLSNFKESITLKASIAFLIIPSNEDNVDKSKIYIFRRIFPTIKLISLYSNKSNAVFSVDSMSNGMYFTYLKFLIYILRYLYNFVFLFIPEVNPVLRHTNSYAFMILTYKF
jgi:hypothetical protein